jgi:hypothetical protein
MENFELNIDISTRINHLNGQFIKGHIPFNKGIPQKKWMDGRKRRRVLKYLELGRKQGNHDLARTNRKPVIAIKDGKLFFFDSATNAARILKSKGIRINARNINSVCNEKIEIVGGHPYIRKKAGGFQWFFANQPEKYKDLIIEK